MSAPGIHLGIENEAYHAGPGISKTGLWTIAQKTPAHYRFEEREDKTPAQLSALDVGTATHYAVLQPELLASRVSRGPADRRGNKWTDAMLYAQANGMLCLTADDFDKVLRIRDSADRNTTLAELRDGAMIEASGYAIDRETGMLCRCRPDGYNRKHQIILDLKTAQAGGRDEFARATANFGYHVQEAFYTDVWTSACDAEGGHISGGSRDLVSGFVFVVLEKTAPFLVSCYELKPSAVDEGREAYRRALRLYAQCKEREDLGMPAVSAWPGYPDDPEPLDIPPWAYRLTAREKPEA